SPALSRPVHTRASCLADDRAVYAPQKRPAHKGCSIVELMIAVAIVADLAVIAVPSFVRSREIGAERALCE
ncbi:MAG: hypothetical protein JWQ44_1393, partial [Chthoniobacter sp.]|nr:hypothetical protein [Chthoniobacter sp.]